MDAYTNIMDAYNNIMDTYTNIMDTYTNKWILSYYITESAIKFLERQAQEIDLPYQCLEVHLRS